MHVVAIAVLGAFPLGDALIPRIPLVVNELGFLSINVTNPIYDSTRLLALDALHVVSVSRGGALELVPSNGTIRLLDSLISIFGSVSILRHHSENSFELVPNISVDSFAHHCVPDSIIRAPLFRSGFGQQILSETNAAFLSLSSVHFFPLHRVDYVAEIPTPQYVHLLRQFPPVAEVSPSRVATFHDCDPNQLLPLLNEIVIVTVNGDSLRISPEDYVEFHPDGGCTLKLIDTMGDPFLPIRIRLNPLAIPNINIRRTNISIEFCDSIF